MARFDLTDFEWSVIEPLLPKKVHGKAQVDDRWVLNGTFWRLWTGGPMRDMLTERLAVASRRSLGSHS